jgi:3D (Asp-Asp-Asp) domain-containing protein
MAAASGGFLVSALSSSYLTPTVQGSSSRSSRSSPEKAIHILVDGDQKDRLSRKTTVQEALAEADVRLGPKDELFPDPDQPIWDGMPIFVCRVRTRLVAGDEKLPYRTRYQLTTTRFRRLPIITQPGRPGLARKRYEVVYRDGQETERRLLATRVLRTPQDQVITAPPRYQLASRGYYGGRRVFRMVATAYDPGPGSCGASADGITAIGFRAGHGIAAVDPALIPMKARLYVEGYGRCVAADIGGAIKGNRIDLGFRSRAEALRYGRKEVIVYVLD